MVTTLALSGTMISQVAADECDIPVPWTVFERNFRTQSFVIGIWDHPSIGPAPGGRLDANEAYVIESPSGYSSSDMVLPPGSYELSWSARLGGGTFLVRAVDGGGVTLAELEAGSEGNGMWGALSATFSVQKRSQVRMDISGDKGTIDATLMSVCLKVRGSTFSQYVDSIRAGAASVTLEHYDKMLRRVFPLPSVIVQDEVLDVLGPATCRGVLRRGVLYQFDLVEYLRGIAEKSGPASRRGGGSPSGARSSRRRAH